MTCSKWREHLLNQVVAVRAYAKAVEELAEVSDAQFNSAWERAERAKRKADIARETMLEHEHSHGCVSLHSTPAFSGSR